KVETSSTQPALVSSQPDPDTEKKQAENGGGGEPPEMLTPPDVAAKKEQVKDSQGPASQPPTTSSPPPNPLCHQIHPDDITTQAKNQFNAGFVSSALALMNKALQCKQSTLMYRLAGMYACRAHDAETARRYYNKVPAQFQPGIEQACQTEGIAVRLPDENGPPSAR